MHRDKSFEQFKFCAVMAADRTVSLDQTSPCQLNGGIPDVAFCAWTCNREPQCMHFNYRKDNRTCDLFYTNQTCFVMDVNCLHFQVDKHSLLTNTFLFEIGLLYLKQKKFRVALRNIVSKDSRDGFKNLISSEQNHPNLNYFLNESEHIHDNPNFQICLRFPNVPEKKCCELFENDLGKVEYTHFLISYGIGEARLHNSEIHSICETSFPCDRFVGVFVVEKNKCNIGIKRLVYELGC